MPSPAGGRVRVARLRLATVLALAAIALVACGGGSKSPAAQSVSSPPVQTSAATSPSSTPTSSSTPSSSSTPVTGTASFCKYAKAEKSEVASEVKAFSVDSPAQLQAFEERALSVITGLASSAPASVQHAVHVVVTGDQSFFNQLKAAHFDYAKLNPTSISKIDTPAFVGATHTVVNYFSHAC
jgi:hypothetical protein